MVEREDDHAKGSGVLQRWSRRKQAVATSSQDSATDNDETAGDAELASEAPPPTASLEASAEANSESPEEEPLLTDEDMPDIESIGKDSDVSCFFNRGVSEQLRQRALKHLLRLPAFNITDGLNDYDEDYTTFEPLGDIVTSDMRFHAKRKEKLAAQQREEEEALARQQAEELDATESGVDDTELAENASEDTVADESAADAASNTIEDSAGSTAQPETTQVEQNETMFEAPVADNAKPGDLA